MNAVLHIDGNDAERTLREVAPRGNGYDIVVEATGTLGAAIDALLTDRLRTDGIITHPFPHDQYGEALAALSSDPTVHKVVITA